MFDTWKRVRLDAIKYWAVHGYDAKYVAYDGNVFGTCLLNMGVGRRYRLVQCNNTVVERWKSITR